MTDYGRTLPRLREMPVLIVNGSQRLDGLYFHEHPELPALIEAPSVGRTLYIDVWERMGWVLGVDE